MYVRVFGASRVQFSIPLFFLPCSLFFPPTKLQMDTPQQIHQTSENIAQAADGLRARIREGQYSNPDSSLGALDDALRLLRAEIAIARSNHPTGKARNMCPRLPTEIYSMIFGLCALEDTPGKDGSINGEGNIINSDYLVILSLVSKRW